MPTLKIKIPRGKIRGRCDPSLFARNLNARKDWDKIFARVIAKGAKQREAHAKARYVALRNAKYRFLR